VDEYVNLGDVSGMSPDENTAFSISGYPKTTDSEGPIIALRSPGILALYVGFDGASNDPGKLRFISWHDGVLYRITGPKVNDGRWHHFAVTRSTFGSVMLYLDGQLVGTTFDEGGAYFNQTGALGSDLTWQADNFGSPQQRYLEGQIDEITAWSGTLTAEQIAALAEQLPPVIPGDVTGDGKVDPEDVKALGAAWLSSDTAADVNGDGVVNLEDFAVLAQNWLSDQ